MVEIAQCILVMMRLTLYGTLYDVDEADLIWCGWGWLYMMWMRLTLNDVDEADLIWCGWGWLYMMWMRLTLYDVDEADFIWCGWGWLYMMWMRLTLYYEDEADSILCGWGWLYIMRMRLTLYYEDEGWFKRIFIQDSQQAYSLRVVLHMNEGYCISQSQLASSYLNNHNYYRSRNGPYG